MAIDVATIQTTAEIFSALILLAALVLMAKFYEEYLEMGVQEMNDWKLITIGFAFYIALKTHFSIFTELAGISITGLPLFLVGAYYLTLLVASAFVFLGFYGLVKDYL